MQKVYTVPCVGDVPKPRCPGAAPSRSECPRGFAGKLPWDAAAQAFEGPLSKGACTQKMPCPAYAQALSLGSARALTVANLTLQYIPTVYRVHTTFVFDAM